LSGTVTLGLRRIALARDHILTLAVFGVALWLPYFLRSPGHLIFTDELFHYQVLQLIAESGHTHVPRLGPYPIPGEYPGLELGTLGVMAVTGLPIDIAVRLMTVAAHILIPLLVYVFARGLGLEKRRAFVAALVYMTNTSYFFFHSIFSYETLGIVLFLSLWVLLARHRRRNIGKHDLLLFMPMLFAIAVTHHISSYIFAAAVATKWLAQKVLARGARDRSGIVVAISLLFPAAWLKLRTVHTFTYLFSNMTSRFNFATTQGTSRRLFSVSSVPSLERLIDYMYAPLLPTLTLVGIFLVVRRYGWRNVPPLLLSLAIIGPLA
jgi:hypothetical protein